MKNCKYCQQEIAKTAKHCPNCGGRQGMPIWLIVILTIVAIYVIFVIIGICLTLLTYKVNDDLNTEHEKAECMNEGKCWKDNSCINCYD